MTSLRGGLFLIVIVLLSSSIRAQYHNQDFKQLYTLKGVWEMQTKMGHLFEVWQIANDSTLKSRSYILKDQDTSKLETADLILRNGVIMYVPTVNGQNDDKPVVFTLISDVNGVYVFENKEHDFPQRVVYVLPNNGQLHPWIEGIAKGEMKKIDYNYQLVH